MYEEERLPIIAEMPDMTTKPFNYISRSEQSEQGGVSQARRNNNIATIEPLKSSLKLLPKVPSLIDARYTGEHASIHVHM